MVGVVGHAETPHFTIDLRASGSGTLLRLEDEHPRTVPHDEAVAPGTERARGRFRGVVASRHRLHGAEAPNTKRRDRGFRAAGEEHVTGAHGNELEREAERVLGRCACGCDCEVRTLKVVANGDLSRRRVHHHLRDEVGGHTVRPPLVESVCRVFDLIEAADSRAGNDPEVARRFIADLDARVGDGLVARNERVLGEKIDGALGFSIENIARGRNPSPRQRSSCDSPRDRSG